MQSGDNTSAYLDQVAIFFLMLVFEQMAFAMSNMALDGWKLKMGGNSVKRQSVSAWNSDNWIKLL